jgi:nicotinate-nucleotide adenylyltransferase
MKRIAFYGGSFDPPHIGHFEIARKLVEQFSLDEFVFIPAFHAPHKKERKPTSAFHRFAMLALATNNLANVTVSKMELELPEKPYTVETLTRLKNELNDTEIFFVMGADSWQDILTWREWETVLTMVNIIVVTRPDYEIGFSHVTNAVRERIVDIRGKEENKSKIQNLKSKIFITDAVQIDVSATEIRQRIKENTDGWQKDVPNEVAKHLEKYELYI